MRRAVEAVLDDGGAELLRRARSCGRFQVIADQRVDRRFADQAERLGARERAVERPAAELRLDRRLRRVANARRCGGIDAAERGDDLGDRDRERRRGDARAARRWRRRRARRGGAGWRPPRAATSARSSRRRRPGTRLAAGERLADDVAVEGRERAVRQRGADDDARQAQGTAVELAAPAGIVDEQLGDSLVGAVAEARSRFGVVVDARRQRRAEDGDRARVDEASDRAAAPRLRTAAIEQADRRVEVDAPAGVEVGLGGAADDRGEVEDAVERPLRTVGRGARRRRCRRRCGRSRSRRGRRAAHGRGRGR